jgi:hypothetical protein
MRIPVNFSGKQSPPESNKLGVKNTSTKKSHSTPPKVLPEEGSSQQMTSPTVQLPATLQSLTLFSLKTDFFEPNKQNLPAFAQKPNPFEPKFNKDLKEVLSEPNRKFENKDPNVDISERLRFLAIKDDLDHKSASVMSTAINDAIKEGVNTEEVLKSTIFFRKLLSNLKTITFSPHAYSRAMERGEPLTCTKAIAEFFKNDENSRTYLVFDRTPQEKGYQLGLLRGNSAKDKMTFIPITPSNELIAKSVVALDSVRPNRFFQVTDRMKKPITTLKQYQEELAHLKELEALSKRLVLVGAPASQHGGQRFQQNR